MRISPITILVMVLCAAPSWPQSPAPAPLSLSGQASASTASLSPSAAVLPSPIPSPTETPEPPDVEDDAQALTGTASLDLGTSPTQLLEKISENLSADQDHFLFSVDDNMVVDQAGENVIAVKVTALYAELAKRAVAQDKDARQALLLAELRGDTRANRAMEQTLESQSVAVLIQDTQHGDLGAKDALMKLALQGDPQARAYLGMGQPVPVSLPESMTASAGALSSTASPELSSSQPVTPSTEATTPTAAITLSPTTSSEISSPQTLTPSSKIPVTPLPATPAPGE